MAKRNFFMTGTDTDVGKTYVTCQLLKAFQKQKAITLALKPIATGCKATKAGLRSVDALQLNSAATIKLPYHQLNPFAFTPAIAPHLAADQANTVLTVKNLVIACKPILEISADVLLIEGVGGWCVPLNNNETMADFVKALKLAVILVVGIRLGCINHALLTAEAIKSKQTTCIGWVANCITSSMAAQNENIETLRQLLPMPLLTIFPFQENL